MMRPIDRSLFLLPMLALVFIVQGCATTEKPPDRTGDVTVDLTVINGSQQMRYRVERSGTIQFAGGRDVLLDHFSWEGMLTDDEIVDMLAILQENRWYDPAPSSTGQPEDLQWRLQLDAPSHRRRIKLKGSAPTIEPLKDLLNTAAERRFEKDFDKLPKPGLQR